MLFWTCDLFASLGLAPLSTLLPWRVQGANSSWTHKRLRYRVSAVSVTLPASFNHDPATTFQSPRSEPANHSGASSGSRLFNADVHKDPRSRPSCATRRPMHLRFQLMLILWLHDSFLCGRGGTSVALRFSSDWKRPMISSGSVTSRTCWV